MGGTGLTLKIKEEEEEVCSSVLGKVPGQGWSQAGDEEWDVPSCASTGLFPKHHVVLLWQGLVRRPNGNYPAEPQHSPPPPMLISKVKK